MIGAFRIAERVVELREREGQRVGAEPALVGVELDRAEAARIAQHEVAAVVEIDPESVPLRHAAIARVDERIAGLFVVDEHAATHAEMYPDAHVGIAGIEDDLLPPAPGGRERVADERVPQRGCGSAPLHEPRIGCVHLDDLTIDRVRFEHLPRRFDFQNFRHARCSLLRCW